MRKRAMDMENALDVIQRLNLNLRGEKRDGIIVRNSGDYLIRIARQYEGCLLFLQRVMESAGVR